MRDMTFVVKRMGVDQAFAFLLLDLVFLTSNTRVGGSRSLSYTNFFTMMFSYTRSVKGASASARLPRVSKRIACHEFKQDLVNMSMLRGADG